MRAVVGLVLSLREVTSEAESLLSAVTSIPVLGTAVIGVSSVTVTTAGITAVAPVGVTPIKTAVVTIATPRSAVLQVRLVTTYSLHPSAV